MPVSKPFCLGESIVAEADGAEVARSERVDDSVKRERKRERDSSRWEEVLMRRDTVRDATDVAKRG